MVEVNFLVNSMQLSMRNLLSADMAKEIRDLGKCPGSHHRFLYPYTLVGSRGFRQLYSIEEQAFCQSLAHRGCIPSSLLFGYSLTTDYRDSRRVYCDVNAFEYQFIGIEALMNHCLDDGFLNLWMFFLRGPFAL